MRQKVIKIAKIGAIFICLKHIFSKRSRMLFLQQLQAQMKKQYKTAIFSQILFAGMKNNIRKKYFLKIEEKNNLKK